ncbi:GtrA family protein [Cesiribacter sp. SM1]|uniref:GtrA family protein n=1 Tax=Cesiribacter sp. SM1 TaxID=2861196 RepID=UPI001CD58602|nr:GtrA family protein [Cesiribacter sp. SM1]
MKLLDSAIIKFGLAGIVNTLADYCAYFFVAYYIFDAEGYNIAKGVGAAFGITSAFILNSLWVFRQNFMQEYVLRNTLGGKSRYIASSYGKMFLTYSVGMGLNILIFSNLFSSGHFPEVVCLIAATAVSMVFNFIFTKKIVYATKLSR